MDAYGVVWSRYLCCIYVGVSMGSCMGTVRPTDILHAYPYQKGPFVSV